MPDTPRTTNYFLNTSTGVLKDNTAGDIGADDLRDVVLSSYQPQGTCDFRLGLEEAVPVSTTDQTSKSTIYVNQIGIGNKLGLSDGTYWLQAAVPGFALAGLTGLTSARNYDVFAAYSVPTHSSTNTGTDVVTWSSNPGWTTGTYVLCLSTGSGLTAGTNYWYNRASSVTGSFHTTLANAVAGTSKVDLTGNVTNSLVGFFVDLGPTWNAGAGAGSDTARGTGAGSSALTLLGGTYTNGVSVTGSIGGGTIAASAGLYLGTVRTTGTTTTEDSGGGSTGSVGGKRFVWNTFNKTPRNLAVIDTTDTWTYATNTWRQARATAGNMVEYVSGTSSTFAEAGLFAGVYLDTALDEAVVAVGLDSTTTPVGLYAELYAESPLAGAPAGAYAGLPGLGYHYFAWLEKAIAGTVTFLGDNGSTTKNQSGLLAKVLG